MTRIEVLRGDITTLAVDAIVNAANTSLLGGGGVDGAIHRKGGPKILEECKAIRNRQGGCATGEAVITSGGNLNAKFVIHTVGPVWSGVDHGKLDVLLANAYRNSLALALQHNVTTIAFPNISTGIYGFPKPRAAEIAIREVQNFLTKQPTIAKVFFVCFDEENFDLYETLLTSRR
ncbi:O-acetyl-ADP-ribose deacetylase [Chryseolinea lacunae]|uniref:O-acetyl-ADP-ribose deacetylase n=1 Tax=Chryseolinea lacunae TaxID=2801331 RepID=A0ABS1KUR8_9BACT|nr:O-acetyl-ADP-ribose deacetylase [Chryseolinea lacunae]MBL0743219.1 O-acetyl-ADP-ribose deacetylase [Chryseolinea lacunae]